MQVPIDNTDINLNNCLRFMVQVRSFLQDPSDLHKKNPEPCCVYMFHGEHVTWIPLVIPIPSHSSTWSSEYPVPSGIPQSRN